MTDKLRARARELAEGIADKANECCYRSDGYKEGIAAIAYTVILTGMREALREEPDAKMIFIGATSAYATETAAYDCFKTMAACRARGLE